MAILLNRKYGSRLECLYYILKSCYNKYGTTSQFALRDLKFDSNDPHNVHECCKLTIDVLGKQCCPFLVNKLDSSKCYATQSIDSDSTKSKAVSDIGGSLEALGFIERITSRTYRITKSGENWVRSDFNSEEWENIAREGVLSYGVVIGFLSVLRSRLETFTYDSVYIGYPQTEEAVQFIDEDGISHVVDISNGSEDDSAIRARSRIIEWCISVGLIEPVGVDGANGETLAHLKYRDFLNQRELTTRKFIKTDLFRKIFDTKRYVANPLAFYRLHKSVRSMRENGGEILRKATMQCNDKILNRRFVFTYALNRCSALNKGLDFELLVNCMIKYGENFFTPDNDEYAIMVSESQIADLAGIPFEEAEGMLYPLTTLSEQVLCEDAPEEILNLAKQIAAEIGV